MTSANANRMHGDVLLVGSMPFDDAETVFRETAKGLKGHLTAMPDGEVNERKNWVGMLPEYVFQFHPQLEETVSPGGALEQPDLPEGVHLSELDPFWAFRTKTGEKLAFDNLKYADFAIESYATFKRLRDQGIIEPGTRFQVCLPAPNSAIDAFFNDNSEWPQVHDAYLKGTNHEIQRILEAVPANDLSIQFDMAWELVDLAMGEANYFSFWPRSNLEGQDRSSRGAAGRNLEGSPGRDAAGLPLVLRHLGRLAHDGHEGPRPVRADVERGCEALRTPAGLRPHARDPGAR